MATDWRGIGNMFSGAAAGLTGDSANFQRGLLLQEQQDMKRQEEEQKREAERRKTFFLDAALGDSLRKAGKYDQVAKLYESRAGAAAQFPGVDFSDTTQILALSELAAQGDQQAAKELEDIFGGIKQAGYDTGMLEKPEAPGYSQVTRDKSGRSIGINNQTGKWEYIPMQDGIELAPDAESSPNSVREFQYAQSQGYEGSYQDFLAQKKAGVTVNVGGDGPLVSKPPPGYSAVEDPSHPSGYRYVEIPGGPVAVERAEAEQKSIARQENRARAGLTVVQDLQRSLDLVPKLAQGSGVVGANLRLTAAKVPGTVEYQFNQFKESALSNVGLDTLQQMRENSPTGGALGQVPFQQQQRLEQVLGSLDVTQPPNVLTDNINRVKNIYLDIVYGSRAERKRLVDEGKLSEQEHKEIQSYYRPLSIDEIGRKVEGEEEGLVEPTGSVKILRVRER